MGKWVQINSAKAEPLLL